MGRRRGVHGGAQVLVIRAVLVTTLTTLRKRISGKVSVFVSRALKALKALTVFQEELLKHVKALNRIARALHQLGILEFLANQSHVERVERVHLIHGRGESGVGADVVDEPALLGICGKPHRSILRDDLKPECIRFVLSLLVRPYFHVTQTGFETFGLLRTEVLEVDWMTNSSILGPSLYRFHSWELPSLFTYSSHLRFGRTVKVGFIPSVPAAVETMIMGESFQWM